MAVPMKTGHGNGGRTKRVRESAFALQGDHMRSPPRSVQARRESDKLSLRTSRIELGDDERNGNGSIPDVLDRRLGPVENALERYRHDYSDNPVVDDRLVEDGGKEGPSSCYREQSVCGSAGRIGLRLRRWIP
jgi:hypothetical protein